MPLFYQDGIIQTDFIEVTVNTATTSTTFVNLLTRTITTGDNPVIVRFSASCGNTSATQWTEFRLVIDSVATTGFAIFSTSSGNGNSGALVHKTAALTPGAHTFNIDWHIGTFVGGNATINPTTVNTDHAVLILEEVTV